MSLNIFAGTLIYHCYLRNSGLIACLAGINSKFLLKDNHVIAFVDMINKVCYTLTMTDDTMAE